MTCPKCKCESARITDSRAWHGLTRRKRVCRKCGRWWYTIEVDENWFRKQTADGK